MTGIYHTTEANHSANAGATRNYVVGYAHPGDHTLQGVVILGGQIETRSINVGEGAALRITTFRCGGCDFEIAVMEPMEGGRQ
jgi:hypothetical protein